VPNSAHAAHLPWRFTPAQALALAPV